MWTANFLFGLLNQERIWLVVFLTGVFYDTGATQEIPFQLLYDSSKEFQRNYV